MSRRDRFKRERVLRRKFSLTLFLCFALLAAGFCAVDYSTNSLMYDRTGFGFFTVNHYKNHLELSFFNEKVYFNTSYLSRDMDRLVQFFDRLF
jgi:hypothetical protein